jgi:Transglutaminase-like superfamily
MDSLRAKMARLYKFLRLAPTHQCLFVKSVLLLWVIRLGLWLLPFQSLQRLLAYMVQGGARLQQESQASIDSIVWAVTVASRYVPAATCLTQALAAQGLLAGRGHSARLCIGVARSAAGQFQAHAWVEYAERVVIGGAEAPVRFTPLLYRREKADEWDCWDLLS